MYTFWIKKIIINRSIFFNKLWWLVKKCNDYLNLINRLKENRQTKLYNHGLPLKRVPGLDNCFDCNLEENIWRQYLYKFDEVTNTNISNLKKLE